MNQQLLRSALAGLACSILFATPSLAEKVTLKAAMSAKDEVPPNDSRGNGQVTATYDSATKKLSWKGNYAALSGPATMAHFHGPAEKGKNAPVVIPIFTSAAAAKSPFEGSATLTDDQAKQMLSGAWYVNVHTEAHKPGEIRGQLTK